MHWALEGQDRRDLKSHCANTYPSNIQLVFIMVPLDKHLGSIFNPLKDGLLRIKKGNPTNTRLPIQIIPACSEMRKVMQEALLCVMWSEALRPLSQTVAVFWTCCDWWGSLLWKTYIIQSCSFEGHLLTQQDLWCPLILVRASDAYMVEKYSSGNRLFAGFKMTFTCTV